MTNRLVSVEIDSMVAAIELQRPRQRNAINAELAEQLEQVLADIASDQAVRAVVLAGSGPSFCGGADMTERLAGPQQSRAVFDAVRRCSRAVHDIPLPVVVALQGHALGAGLELAAMCDYRVAARGTLMSIPEVRQGITSGGGLLALSSLVGRGTLARLAFSGDQIDAAEAHRLGVVDELVEPGDARERAVEVARSFAASPRAALIAAKVALRIATQQQFDQQWQALGLLQETMEGGPAQREAIERLRAERAARSDR